MPKVSLPWDDVAVLSELPFELPRDWRGTLGEFKSQRLEQSTLFVLATAPSSAPYDADAQREMLIRRVRAFCFGLWMLGASNFTHGFLMAGGTGTESPQILMVQDLVAVFVRPRGTQVPVSPDVLRPAALVATGLISIHKVRQFDRLERGFWTWVGGIRETHLHIRLHQFVRAVDAMVVSEIGKGRKQFVERSRTFASGDRVDHILGELYDLRSSEEHFRPFQEALQIADADEAERVGLFRAYQAERLAASVYCRVLANPALLEQFSEVGRLRAFWARSEAERRGIWQDPIDLSSIETEILA